MTSLRAFGPIELWSADRPVDLGPSRQRALLAALLVEDGRPVPLETLIDRVWDTRPPASVRDSVYSYVTRLRQALAGAGPVIVRGPGGYALHIDDEQVDIRRFRALVDTPAPDRRAALREALGLWRAEPLAGIAGEWAEQVREGLRRHRIRAVLDLAGLEHADGNGGTVVDQLELQCAAYPLTEPLVAALMTALRDAGRDAEALERYERMRLRLRDELGTEPGADLRRLHAEILAEPAAVPSTLHRPSAVPAQLPRAVPGFTGRDAELAVLDELAETRTDPVVVVLTGLAGVGKTTLLVHWAHRAAAGFGDGQLHVDLGGFRADGTAVTPGAALAGFLQALGVPPARQPSALAEQPALYRRGVGGRRMLVVLDNARDPDQVMPLLPGSAGCMVLITSRNRLTGLVAATSARPLPLDVLSPDEARGLLDRRLGPDRTKAEPDAVDEIVTRCGRLPLALSVIAANAATRPYLSLAALAESIGHRHNVLDALSTTDTLTTDLRAVFASSYGALADRTAAVFRLLGTAPGPEIGVPAAASLAGLPDSTTRALLDRLTAASLLTEHQLARYQLHDLLHAYAAEQARLHDTAADRRAATHRLLDHYLHTADNAARMLNPDRSTLAGAPPRPGVSPERFGTHEEALAWFAAERPTLLAAVEHAAADGFDTHAWQLAQTLDIFLNRRGYGPDWVAAGRVAVSAARRLADLSAQAGAHRNLGRAHLSMDRLDDAHAELGRALDASARAGDRAGQADTHLRLANVRERQRRPGDALDHAQRAHDLYQAAGHRLGVALALNAVGWYRAHTGDLGPALSTCERALGLLQEIGNQPGEASAWDSIGYVRHRLGRHDEAVDCFRRAVDLYRDLGHRYYEATSLTHLGDTHHTAGNTAAATLAWRQAAVILAAIEHPDLDSVRTRLAAPKTQ